MCVTALSGKESENLINFMKYLQELLAADMVVLKVNIWEFVRNLLHNTEMGGLAEIKVLREIFGVSKLNATRT